MNYCSHKYHVPIIKPRVPLSDLVPRCAILYFQVNLGFFLEGTELSLSSVRDGVVA